MKSQKKMKSKKISELKKCQGQIMSGSGNVKNLNLK